jgi:hypothetical protein
MRKIAVLLSIIAFWSCQNEEPSISVQVKNPLDIDRSFETVEINAEDLVGLNSKAFHVIDKALGDTLVSQTIDYDADGQFDVLLFQPEIKANDERDYQIFASEVKNQEALCYARFVPERTDDYAWENNRVAFRTYGPTAQKMVEDSIKGGTLSSGIDAWLKRVEYPVINKWYKKYTSGEGSYHEDTGEGLDNFHVGSSRGVGGIAFKTDSIYKVSKNFVNHKTIATGPLRTVFQLDYGTYDINGEVISETKTISLDYGQNLSKFSVKVKGTETLSAGLTLHDNLGETTVNKNEAWMSYWEPHDGSELGQGLVIANPENLVDFDKYVSEEKDQSNLFARVKVENSKVNYYAGFGWKKSGQFQTKKEWEFYLSEFSKKIQNPLTYNITK